MSYRRTLQSIQLVNTPRVWEVHDKVICVPGLVALYVQVGEGDGGRWREGVVRCAEGEVGGDYFPSRLHVYWNI